MEPSSETSGWVMRQVDQYQGPLILYARQITGRLDTAREVVQETFLRLCRQSPQTLNGAAGPWLYRVCRNLAIDVIRRERAMQNIDTCGGATLAAPAAPGGEHAEQAAEAERLLAGLPDNQREALRLKFHHGLSYKEIAHTMGLTSNYVGVLIHNGLTALRGQMTTRA